jgi:hypothetical protein
MKQISAFLWSLLNFVELLDPSMALSRSVRKRLLDVLLRRLLSIVERGTLQRHWMSLSFRRETSGTSKRGPDFVVVIALACLSHYLHSH